LMALGIATKKNRKTGENKDTRIYKSAPGRCIFLA